MKTPSHSQKGFTLIELLVVISIISMLSSVAYASYGTVKAKSRDTKRAADTVQLRTALTAYEIDHNGLPAATVAAGCIAASDSNPTPTWVCTTSQSLNATLQPLVSGKYISAIPVDPLNSGGITYYYSTGASTGNDPVTGTALAPSASFNYVSETRTSQTTPAIYGTNVGTPNYTYYASTGYPSSVGTITVATQPHTIPATPVGLSIYSTLAGGALGANSNQTASALLAVQQQLPKPTISVTTSWSKPTNTTDITGYVITSSGSSPNPGPHDTTGTSYNDGHTWNTNSQTFSDTYSVVAYNSYGTSSPTTLTFNIPEVTLTPQISSINCYVAIQNPDGSTTPCPTNASIIVTPSILVPGAIYTIRYDTASSQLNVYGMVTIGSNGTSITSIDPQFPIANVTSWRADLHSLPMISVNPQDQSLPYQQATPN